ncbi:hypothetical protein P152DRAFT_452772 [Eremomyces bilateralis CBS 781.70]|uniref:GPI anchored protein n=1 Tax=Eremomyces bilateralis CBS 781.70 TaxID=1392243 RepID=A0A6G1FS07_9PEZI|nr:uncharacterized protein P152DRAFT_452772 [Eremomyces bilateralis CBS 781.70]KAF1808557.1 hypothetical protein P152DRAFT_452772 [Eremomyces bilateralis CBS 781.70]
MRLIAFVSAFAAIIGIANAIALAEPEPQSSTSGSCSSAQQACNGGCISRTATCCAIGDGGCRSGTYCVVGGCCKIGKICDGSSASTTTARGGRSRTSTRSTSSSTSTTGSKSTLGSFATGPVGASVPTSTLLSGGCVTKVKRNLVESFVDSVHNLVVRSPKGGKGGSSQSSGSSSSSSGSECGSESDASTIRLSVGVVGSVLGAAGVFVFAL